MRAIPWWRASISKVTYRFTSRHVEEKFKKEIWGRVLNNNDLYMVLVEYTLPR